MLHLRWINAILLAAGAALSVAQEPAGAVIHNTFEKGPAGWQGVGAGSKATVTNDAALLAPDKAGLKFGYEIKAGNFCAALLPTPIGTLKGVKSIKFRIRSDATTLIAVMLTEQDGGRYQSMVYAPKDKWQDVELSVSDFNLARDATDPKDPNAKLDMDQVSSILVADLAQFFVQVADKNLSSLLKIQPGEHSLYLTNFLASTNELVGSVTSSDDEVILENFLHPQLAWFGLGGVQLTRSEGKPLDGGTLKAEYQQSPDVFAALTRAVKPWVLTDTKGISLDVASLRPTKLLVQLEQVDGNKFNYLVEIPGGSEKKTLKANYSEFKVSDDSKDLSAKLQIENVKTLVIVDAYGFQQNGLGANTLWVGKLKAFLK